MDYSEVTIQEVVDECSKGEGCDDCRFGIIKEDYYGDGYIGCRFNCNPSQW